MRPVDGDKIIEDIKDIWRWVNSMVEKNDEEEHDIGMCGGLLLALRVVTAAPTIESKHGKWIDEHEDGRGSWVGTCDQCNKENHVDNFCPHCGARMEETK